MGRDRFKTQAQQTKHYQPSGQSGGGSTNQLHPIFCLKHLGNADDCDAEDFSALLRTMHTLAKQTWQDINGRDRHKGGSEQIRVKDLRGVKVPKDIEEIGYVLAFRYSGKKPMLCSRSEQLLRILHLDRNFTAYQH